MKWNNSLPKRNEKCMTKNKTWTIYCNENKVNTYIKRSELAGWHWERERKKKKSERNKERKTNDSACKIYRAVSPWNVLIKDDDKMRVKRA